MKKQTLISAVSLIAVSLAFSASAAMVRTGEKYTLGAGESVGENLYVGSADINISGDVRGDLMAGGGNIMVTGQNYRDVMLLGGSITVLGPTSDDLRMAGGNLVIGKSVGGDLTVAGGNIHLLSDAIVGGEMIAVGGNITVDGTVTKDLAVMGGDLTINGKVLGNVRIQSIQKLTIGSGAVINGKLTYASANDAVIMEGAKITGAVLHKPAADWGTQNNQWMKKNNDAWKGFMGFLKFIGFMAYLAAVLLLVRFFKNDIHRAGEGMLNNFWPNTLRGFLVAILVPMALLLLAITIIGFVPALLAGLIYMGLWTVAKLLASVFVGAWLFKRFSKEKAFTVDWKSATLGVVCFYLLKSIPVLGWLAVAAIMFSAMGELSNSLYHKAKELLNR